MYLFFHGHCIITASALLLILLEITFVFAHIDLNLLR